MVSTCRYRMFSLVEQILALHKQLPESPHASRKDRPAAPHRGHGRAESARTTKFTNYQIQPASCPRNACGRASLAKDDVAPDGPSSRAAATSADVLV